MKTRLLIIIAFVLLLPLQTIYAPPPPDPESDFYYSDHVVTGVITSSEIIVDPREDNSSTTFYDTVIYQVEVSQWHKNPLTENTVTVYGIHFPNNVNPEPQWGIAEFEIGDMVYLYLDYTDDGLKFREYGSYLIEPEPEQDELIYVNCGFGTTLQDGICVVNETTDNAIDSSDCWGGPACKYEIQSPLKQFKLGIPVDEIQCNESLILVTKNNGTPACVKEQTLLKLVERKLIITSKAEGDLMLDAGYKLFPGVGWVEQEKSLSPEPEPERNPVPEGNYVDKNIYVYSVNDAESHLNYTLSTPYLPEGTELEKIKISGDKRKATIFYSNGLEIKHNPMGINFNNTHYKLNPEREAGKIFYDFRGTFAEGYEIDEPNRPHYSTIIIHRDDRIYIRATMDAGLDELLKMIEPMDLNVPHVRYTPTLDYVMGAPEPEPTPEPENEN
ncbi:hypothetical protein [Nitrosopumilus sp.]|uniref:hypothetical protein n=1 Tax=Nitrosopumilus sp. TaxID=2024843 RepID=UPI003D10B474